MCYCVWAGVWSWLRETHANCVRLDSSAETIRSVSESIYTGKARRVEAEKDQSNLLENMVEFNDKSRPRSKEGK